MVYNKYYQEDLKKVAILRLPWEQFKNKSIMLSGATGLIGSFFVDVIMKKNTDDQLNCSLYAIGRDEHKAYQRFQKYWDRNEFHFVQHDVNQSLDHLSMGDIDYVLHLASNTHPMAYATDPVGTITANIYGLKNMLDYSSTHGVKRFAFASSNEIYGENRGDVELFTEDYCGYIDCNTMRAGYPESKRCGEALCQAYIAQKGMDIVIPRFTRTYGPTMLLSDTKAISQFIRKAIQGEDIVLKSEGKQYYSYTYVADAVSGLLTVLMKGKTGEAYNIADQRSDITLADLAGLIAARSGKEVIFELPDSTERAGYSTATKARLDATKLRELGWIAQYDIKEGISRTISILRDI